MTKSQDVRYFDGSDALDGVFTWDPSINERRPAVLVIHGGAGLDDHARGRARRFAEAGYLAFASDMYGENVRGKRDRVMQQIAALRSDRDALRRRVDAAIAALRSHERCDGRIVVVGYCLGGMIALELARTGIELAGVIGVHGNLGTSSPAEPGSIRTPILVCHGALDPHAPVSQVSAFVEEMNQAGADYQLIVYGGALHGFTHESATQLVNGVLYNAKVDARSSEAIQAFLNEHLTTFVE